MNIVKFTLLGSALFGLACGESDPCGAGMVSSNGSCVAAAGASGSSAGSSGSGGATAGSGGATAGSGGATAGSSGTGTAGQAGAAAADFGDACSTHGECGGMTNYCAVQPGQPGYCTVSGCDADMSLCPDGWSCFNVGQFSPGEPWICIQ